MVIKICIKSQLSRLKIMNCRYYKTTINSVLKLYNYSFNFFTL